MATQPPAPRPWFRLPSLARPVLPVPPTPEPPPPQIRAPMARPPAFRAQPPQEPAPVPETPTPAAGVSSVPTSPIRRTSLPPSPPGTGPAAPPPSPQPLVVGVSSVPTSPTKRTSVPSSPVRQPSLIPTMPASTATTSSVPSSPKPQVPAPFPSPKPPASPTKSSTFSIPTSPPKPEPTVTTHVPSPTPSPRTLKPVVHTPPQSPMTKPTARPPSPLTLPPPQLKLSDELEPKIPEETEQKTVLVQNSIENSKPRFNGVEPHKAFRETHNHSVSQHHHVKHEVPKDDGKKEKGRGKKFSLDSDREVPLKVITIAGDNKGAFMEVIKSPMRRTLDDNSHNLHKRVNPKSESGGTEGQSYSSSSSSGEEGKTKMKDQSHRGHARLSPPLGAFMNSNVQGVNNSIVLNSSCTHHDPGVHFALSRKPFGHGFPAKEKNSGHHS